MPTTVWATVSQGKIELLDPIDLPEGARVLVTLFPTPAPLSPELDTPEPDRPRRTLGALAAPQTQQIIYSESSPTESGPTEPDFWLQPEADDVIWDNLEEAVSEPFLPISSLSSSPPSSRTAE